MQLSIAPLPERTGAEVVERKGRGHPDTVADALAESFGLALCRYYRARWGRLLHYNVDKALLVGGASRPAFGGGEILAPVEIILGGRATLGVGDERVPVEDIARETVEAWFRAHSRFPVEHLRITTKVRGGSVDLVDLFEGEALANDTSFGVGHAPASALEAGLLAADRALAGSGEPAFGEDVKLMGVHLGATTAVTAAVAMIGRHLPDEAAYERARQHATTLVGAENPGADVTVNAADGPGRWFLTVTGTSLEAGDDGQVGRGNRPGGLITPGRPTSLEAAAGKNPVTHVGKLYNLVAARIAAGVAALDGVAEADCLLVSRIGRPIRDPWLAQVRVRGAAREADVEGVLRAELDALPALTEAIVAGRTPGY